MKQPHFLHGDRNSQNLEVDRKVFGWTWSKISGQSGLWVLKLTVSQE